GDLNGDGMPDIAWPGWNSDGSAWISIFPGHGDGTFGSELRYNGGATNAYSVRVLDLNGDGNADVTLGGEGVITVLLGNGDGAFGRVFSYATASGPSSIAAADFNADGRVDLAVADRASNQISILLGAADGSLGQRLDLAAATDPMSVAVADFDADGRPDLAV